MSLLDRFKQRKTEEIELVTENGKNKDFTEKKKQEIKNRKNKVVVI